jgi:hypothetical protein
MPFVLAERRCPESSSVSNTIEEEMLRVEQEAWWTMNGIEIKQRREDTGGSEKNHPDRED